jgi:dihydrofolate reductase
VRCSSTWEEAWDENDEFIATLDAIVMGRNAWDVVLGRPAWPVAEKRVVVLSNRPVGLSAAAGHPVELMTKYAVAE